jgi:hypothetical protein
MVPTLSNKSTPLPTVLIDGMKSAQSRAKHQEKAAAGKKGGGGSSGMQERKGGDMGQAMAAAQAERARVKAMREEKKAKGK